MDNPSFSPIMISSSSSSSSSDFLTTGSLLQPLIHISNEIASMENIPFTQSKNISNMIRRIKLLSSLYEDIQEQTNHSSTPLPPSSILCLNELLSLIQRVKLLIHWCKDGSSLWGILETDYLSNQFYVLAKEMGKALDILPLSLLNLSLDTREQVELVRKQVKRITLFVDPREILRRKEVIRIMELNNNKCRRFKGFIDLGKVKEVLCRTGLEGALDYEDEIAKLESEVHKQAGTGGLIAVSNINNLISLLIYTKSMIFKDSEIVTKDSKHEPDGSVRNLDVSSSSRLLLPNIPDEFRCPISLDLMEDPVIVSSGHTYDRKSIAQWINSGHQTCPKSGQKLNHIALIPNYALKSLVHQWCRDNDVSLIDSLCSISSKSDIISNRKKNSFRNANVDHVSAKASTDAVKITAEFLVGKLAMGSLEIQQQAAYEIRLLAKTSMDNRRIIAEAGAIPFLVTLLRSNDPRIQENVVTALLNLSIFENNKVLIMEAGALGNIISILESGKTMEARENGAAVIFSLSMIDHCKVKIGAHPKAIPALVGLLNGGTAAGKRDAASALFNLAMHNSNKASVVAAGAVPKLIKLLMDDRAGITDEALAVLAQLLGSDEGVKEMRKSSEFVRLLIDLLRYGSVKGKEICITILLGMCRDEGEQVARRLLMNPRSIPSLQRLVADGSTKARRKADALLRLLDRCCSKPHNPF